LFDLYSVGLKVIVSDILRLKLCNSLYSAVVFV